MTRARSVRPSACAVAPHKSGITQARSTQCSTRRRTSSASALSAGRYRRLKPIPRRTRPLHRRIVVLRQRSVVLLWLVVARNDRTATRFWGIAVRSLALPCYGESRSRGVAIRPGAVMEPSPLPSEMRRSAPVEGIRMCVPSWTPAKKPRYRCALILARGVTAAARAPQPAEWSARVVLDPLELGVSARGVARLRPSGRRRRR